MNKTVCRKIVNPIGYFISMLYPEVEDNKQAQLRDVFTDLRHYADALGLDINQAFAGSCAVFLEEQSNSELENVTHTVQQQAHYINVGGTICPMCDSDKLKSGDISINNGFAEQRMKCCKCDLEWKVRYILHSIVHDSGAERNICSLKF